MLHSLFAILYITQINAVSWARLLIFLLSNAGLFDGGV